MNFLRNTLQLKRMHIDTQIEHVVYMLKGCSVYKSEGFESLSRVQVEVNGKKIIASLNLAIVKLWAFIIEIMTVYFTTQN